MNVSIYGLGYVGAVTAACMAALGHTVVGVDIDAGKVQTINAGRSPVREPQLDCLIAEAKAAGRLRATTNAEEGVAESDILMVAVGTPSDSSGGVDHRFLDRVCADIGSTLAKIDDYRAIVIRSTILPGVLSSRLEPLLASTSGKAPGMDFGMAVNPEFLREGSAVADFMSPPFTLIGEQSERAGDLVAQLYEPLTAPVVHMAPDAASMVKYASNAFHALKVAFANEIGRVCKQSGVDGQQVMKVFAQDRQLNISDRYLRPGFAFGGSCLPKDMRALLYLSRHADLRLPVIEAVLPSNKLQIQAATDIVLRDGRKRVGVIGLTFKPGTDDLRESPVVELVEALTGKGMQVKIYDQGVVPNLIGSNKAYIEAVLPHISGLMCENVEEVVGEADIVVIAHVRSEDTPQILGCLTEEQLVIDLGGAIDGTHRIVARYQGLGW
jgi:GDP-mannose 6-dehydrogenase